MKTVCSTYQIHGGERVNNVSLVGRLTKNPELRHVANDKKVSSFTLAISRKFKNLSGDIDTDFIQCNTWGPLAEHVVRYCGKGSLIGVSGRLQARSYDNSEGKRIYITDVVAEEVKFFALKSPVNEPASKIEFELPALMTDQVELD